MNIGRPLILSNEVHENIRSAYQTGDSLISLGRKYKVSKDTIKLLLIKMNIHIRNSEEVNKSWNYNKNQLKNLYIIQKKSIHTIAKILESGDKAVKKALIKEGIQLRSRNDYRQPLSQVTREKIRKQHLGRPGKSWSEETRKKMMKILIGRKHTKETRIKMSKIRIEKGLSKGEKNPMANPENILKWIKSNHLVPNKQESKLHDILEIILPNEYPMNMTGNILIINNKIPDFVCLNRKKIIELYGDYWHKGENEEDRINEFKNQGFSTLIIWEKELQNTNMVKNRIIHFHKDIN